MAGQGKLVGQEVDILEEDLPDGAGGELLRCLPDLAAVDDLADLQLEGDAAVVQLARHVLQPDRGVEQLDLHPHDDAVDGLGQQLHPRHHVLGRTGRAPRPGLAGARRHVLRLHALVRQREGGEALAHGVEDGGGYLGGVGSLLDLDCDGEPRDGEVAALREQVGPWYRDREVADVAIYKLHGQIC